MIFPIPKCKRPRAIFSIYEATVTHLFRHFSMLRLMMNLILQRNEKLQTRLGKNTLKARPAHWLKCVRS